MVLEVKSTFATPLFSCKVTQAVLESSEIVMYSGSISCAKLLANFETLKPSFFRASAWPANEAKSKVVTL
ncbi:hypothetical protein D9M71_599150 [compost metagenome]